MQKVSIHGVCDHNQATQVASHLQQDPVIQDGKGELVCMY